MYASSEDVLFGEVIEPDDEFQSSRQQQSVARNFWSKMRQAAGKVPFMDEVVAAYFCAMDSRTPTRVRTILFSALAYFIMPLDAIPDMLIFAGYSDDIAVLTMAISAVRAHITDAHRDAAKQALKA